MYYRFERLVVAAWSSCAIGFMLTSVAGAAEAERQPDPVTIAAEDILSRADADERFAIDVRNRAGTLDRSDGLATALAELAHSVDARHRQLGTQDLQRLPILRLQSLARHWRFLDHQLRAWREALAGADATYLSDAAEMTRRQQIWKATLADPLILGSPVALLERARSVQTELASAEQVLSVPIEQHIRLSRQTLAIEAQIRAGQRQVARAIAGNDLRLRRIDSPPLWAIRDAPATEGAVPIDEALSVETSFSTEYAQANSAKFRGLRIFELLLLPLLFWLKYRARRLDAHDAQVLAAKKVLQRPISSWLLLVAGGILLVQSDAPVLVHQLVLAIALVPVLRLLPPRVYELLGPWPYVISALYLLDLVGFAVASQPLPHRLYLLGYTAAALIFLVWFLLKTRIAATSQGGVREAVLVVRAAGWVAAAVLAISIAMNIIGNVTLAEMLASTLALSAYAALVLYAGVHVLISLLHLLLVHRSDGGQRVSGKYGAELLRGTTWAVQLAALACWLIITLGQARVLAPVHDAVRAILTAPLRLGQIALTLGGILLFVFSVWLAFWVAKAVRVVLQQEVLPTMSLPRGIAHSVSSLAYYALIVAGLSVALVAAGFDVGHVTIVLGALGVGVGFGLQGVVSNFVSGLILMFERPIQPGDVIEITGTSGKVREISMRSTIITTFDGADVVVPNGMLLAEKLVNWTFMDLNRRMDVDISIAYGADPKQVMELLLQIARSTPGVAVEPQPAVVFTALGDSGLQFAVRAWTNDLNMATATGNELALRIHDALVSAGLQISLPQRDLHLKTVSAEAARAIAREISAPPGTSET